MKNNTIREAAKSTAKICAGPKGLMRRGLWFWCASIWAICSVFLGMEAGANAKPNLPFVTSDTIPAPAGQSKGDVLRWEGAVWGTATGEPGHVLKMDSAGLMPVWGSPSSPTTIALGCTDSTACNFDADAGVLLAGSCNYSDCLGCTDSLYLEFNPAATVDDGSCVTLAVPGCTDLAYLEYDAEANQDDGSCSVPIVFGCTDSLYVEFNPIANTDDGSCSELVPVIPGCTDADAENYDSSATEDDGSCTYPSACDPVTFDGYTYDVVEIGDQCWFAENLRSDNYGNGDPIPGGLSSTDWASTVEGAQAIYGEGSSLVSSGNGDEEANFQDYGRLYNWYAVDDNRGLCPNGWHVPSDEEWMTLEMALGMSTSEANATGNRGTDQGDQMKSSPEDIPSWNGSNSSGFSALPGGFRYNGGSFASEGTYGQWWSTSPDETSTAWHRMLSATNDFVLRTDRPLAYGYSIRCVLD